MNHNINVEKKEQKKSDQLLNRLKCVYECVCVFAETGRPVTPRQILPESNDR